MKKSFLDEESGQAMVEYGFIILMVSTVAIGLLSEIGQKILTMYLNPVLDGFK